MKHNRLLSFLTFLQFIALGITLSSCSTRNPQSEIISVNGLEILHNYYPVNTEGFGTIIPAEEVLFIDEERAGLPAGDFIATTSDVIAGPNGEILLLDNILCQIFIFSADGQYLRSFARSGSGPGELSNPYRLARLESDQFIVTEAMDSKAQIFTYGGLFIRQLILPTTLIRCIAPDGEGGFFLSDRASRRKPGETGQVNGTILYRLNYSGQVIPFELSSGEQDTLEIARMVVAGEERFFHRISNSRNLFSTPDKSVIVAGLNYTFYRVTKGGRMAGFRRVGDPYSYPGWYKDAARENWVQRGSRGDPPRTQGFYIEPSYMVVDERGHLWVLPMDGHMWSNATSIEDMGQDGVFALDEFSPEGLWLRHLLIQLPEPCVSIALKDAAHGYLYGITIIGDPDDEVRMPIRMKRP